MKILVDGDSCSKLKEIEKIACLYGLSVYVFTRDAYERKYSTVIHVAKGRDEADFALLGKCEKGDIVITHDTGLAALALSKRAKVMNCRGQVYNDKNISYFLARRYMRKSGAARAGRNSIKGMGKSDVGCGSFEEKLTTFVRNGKTYDDKKVFEKNQRSKLVV